MKSTPSVAGILFLLLLAAGARLTAQELEPKAYSVSPVGVNFVVLGYNLSDGDIAFDPSIPVQDAHARLNTMSMSYGRSFGLAGRTANAAVIGLYTIGNLEGVYQGTHLEGRRSGLRDPAIRFAVNLFGAPAMNLKEFASYRQRTNLGFSLTVVPSLGQYNPNAIVNIGTNRWSFKPELGLSRAAGKWTFDIYGGAWLFTDNTNFYKGHVRSQEPIGSVQIHIIRTLARRMWLAFDANFYTGGTTSVDGGAGTNLQRNSRIGATYALPIKRRHSIKFSFSRGAYTTIGADFNSVSVGYQYLWGAGL